MSDIRMTGADHSHTNAITIDARCRDDFCVRNKPDIYRMVGDCENCGTKGILFLLTAEHERGAGGIAVSFAEVTMYRIECDYEERDGDGSPISGPCGRSPGDDSDYYAWLRSEDAQDEITESDEWATTEDGRHFCPEHAWVARPPLEGPDAQTDPGDIPF